jgi:hypothetical protein
LLAFPFATLASCALFQSPDAGTIELEIDYYDGQCQMVMAGEGIPTTAEIVPAVRDSGATRVRLVTRQNVPYRCVGGAVFYLQRAGYEISS